MIPVHIDYAAPQRLDEALALLKADPQAAPLAGGLNLIPAMTARRLGPKKLIDLRKIAKLSELHFAETHGGLRIGAMATYEQIAAHEAVRENYGALRDVIEQIGDPQVCNRGTLGGSLAYNDPAADPPAAALALGATVHIAGANGQRTLPIEQFVLNEFTTALKLGEIIVAIGFPLAAGGSAYEKFKHPASGYAICGVAAFVEKATSGKIGTCRVAITGTANHAMRVRTVEAALEGKPPSSQHLTAAAKQITGGDLMFRTDLAASAEYRAHLAEVLAERALVRAVERAAF